jgi:hypothetical protein
LCHADSMYVEVCGSCAPRYPLVSEELVSPLTFKRLRTVQIYPPSSQCHVLFSRLCTACEFKGRSFKIPSYSRDYITFLFIILNARKSPWQDLLFSRNFNQTDFGIEILIWEIHNIKVDKSTSWLCQVFYIGTDIETNRESRWSLWSFSQTLRVYLKESFFKHSLDIEFIFTLRCSMQYNL